MDVELRISTAPFRDPRYAPRRLEIDRRPGDIHVHCFGTATLSFAAGIRTQAGDVFEISAPEFGLPLANPLAVDKVERVRIRRL
jgi:hypothetical protein